jgi:hypothetical protein
MSNNSTNTSSYLTKDDYVQLNLHDHINEDEIHKLPKILAIALHYGFYAVSIVERQTDDNLPNAYRFNKLAKYLKNSPFYIRDVVIDSKKLDYLVSIGLEESFLNKNPKWNYLKGREIKFLRGKEYELNRHLLAYGSIPVINSEVADVILESCIKSNCVITLPHAMSISSGGLGFRFILQAAKKYPNFALSLEINGNAPEKHDELVQKIAKILNLPLTAGQDLHLDWGKKHEHWYCSLPVTGLHKKYLNSEDVLENLRQAMISHRNGDHTAFKVFNLHEDVPLGASAWIHILRYFKDKKAIPMTLDKLFKGIYFKNFKRGIKSKADNNFIYKKFNELKFS